MLCCGQTEEVSKETQEHVKGNHEYNRYTILFTYTGRKKQTRSNSQVPGLSKKMCFGNNVYQL